MTITYADVSWKLLLKWKGSIWKACYIELTIYLVMYYVISFIYRFGLNHEQKVDFEAIVKKFDAYSRAMPITFLLGFYVTSVVSRWWSQFDLIPWPDEILSFLCTVIRNQPDDDGTVARRTFARYLNLSTFLCWRDISDPVRKRFPTTQHFVSAGLMTEQELALFEACDTYKARWSMPLQWAERLAENEADKRKAPPPVFSALLLQLFAYREKLRKLYCYDWICIPLIYTQVSALIVYVYLAFCVIGEQQLEHQGDLYFPFFSTLMLVFYVGWFKVAQYLMRPFGDDDDDFDMNYLIDRNIQVSFAIVDQVYNQELPPTVADKYCGKCSFNLPHTRLSQMDIEKDHPPKDYILLEVKDRKEEEFIEKKELEKLNEEHYQNVRPF